MYPFNTLLTISASTALILGESARAREIAVFGRPTVAYEGQRTLVTSEASLVQNVHSKPGKNRTATALDGQAVIKIWRDDLQKL